MPSIDISDKQAAALERGESITVKPDRVLHNVIVRSSLGSSYYVWDGVEQANGAVYATRFQRLNHVDGRLTQEVANTSSRNQGRGDLLAPKASLIVQVGA